MKIKTLLAVLALVLVSCNQSPVDPEEKTTFAQELVDEFIVSLGGNTSRSATGFTEDELSTIKTSIESEITSNGLDQSEDLKQLLKITSGAAQKSLKVLERNDDEILNGLSLIGESAFDVLGNRSDDILESNDIIGTITNELVGNLSESGISEAKIVDALKITTETLIVSLSEVSAVAKNNVSDTISVISKEASVAYSKTQVGLTEIKEGLNTITQISITSIDSISTISVSDQEKLEIAQDISASITSTTLILKDDGSITEVELFEVSTEIMASAKVELEKQSLINIDKGIEDAMISAMTEGLLSPDGEISIDEIYNALDDVVNINLDDLQSAINSGKDKFLGDYTVYALGYGDDSTPDGMAFVENIKAFKAKYPNINVVWDMQYDELYHMKMQSDLAAGNQLDVLYMWNGGPRHRPVKDAGEEIDQLQFINPSNFDTAAVALDPVDGVLYTVPVSKGTHTVFYSNDDLLKELGLEIATTYEELLRQKSVAEAHGKIILAYPGATAWCQNTFIYSVLMARFGGAAHVNDLISKKAKFTDAPSLNSFKFIDRMFDDGIFTQKTLNADYGISLAQFNANAALYFIDGGWRAAQVTVPNFTWNKFPAVPGEVVSGSGNGGYSAGYAMTKSAALGPQREAAIKLLQYLTGEEASRVRARITGAVPSFKVEGPVEYKAGTEQAANYIASLTEISKTVGDNIDGSTNDVYCNGIIDMGLGNITPEQLAQDVQNQYEK